MILNYILNDYSTYQTKKMDSEQAISRKTLLQLLAFKKKKKKNPWDILKERAYILEKK